MGVQVTQLHGWQYVVRHEFFTNYRLTANNYFISEIPRSKNHKNINGIAFSTRTTAYKINFPKHNKV